MKPGEAGQPDAREQRGEEQAAEDRCDLHTPRYADDLARVPALVEHADHEEQRAGGERVATPS